MIKPEKIGSPIVLFALLLSPYKGNNHYWYRLVNDEWVEIPETTLRLMVFEDMVELAKNDKLRYFFTPKNQDHAGTITNKD